MPTIKNLTEDTAAVVGLPDDVILLRIFTDKSGSYLTGYMEPLHDLPPGSWSIVGWSDELTEEQCENIVDVSVKQGSYISFVDYEFVDFYHTATESFASLLRSHGITDRALIIKKEKL